MKNKKAAEVLKIETDEERDQVIYNSGFIPGWIGEGGLRPEPIHDFEANAWRWGIAK